MNAPKNFFQTLRQWLDDLSPDCRRAARLQSDALDRKLSLLQRVGLRVHLLLCKWCRRYGKHLGLLRTACHKCTEEDHDPHPQNLSPEARERIKSRLAEENQGRSD
jgi:hypothetical protein